MRETHFDDFIGSEVRDILAFEHNRSARFRHEI